MNAESHLDIEDNYTTYLSDEAGYAYDAWDTLPADVIRKNDALATLKVDDLHDIDPSGLSNLLRWTYGRRWRALGDVEAFHDAARLITANPADSQGLELVEVFDVLIRSLGESELFDEARLLSEQMLEKWPNADAAHLCAAILEIQQGQDIDETLERVLKTQDPDDNNTDLLYEMCEELAILSPESVPRWIARTRSVATKNDDRPALVDLELLEARLTIGE